MIGLVVNAQGAWYDKSQNTYCPLSRMYPVTESTVFVSRSPAAAVRTVTIRSRWGEEVKVDCAEGRELHCKDPIKPKDRITLQRKEKGGLASLWDAISQLASDSPKTYDKFRQGILQVRGVEAKSFSDGVAEITEQGGVNIQSILARLPAGDYLLELCPLNENAEAVCPKDSKPVNYSWNPMASVAYRPSDIHPGIYRLYLWDASGGTALRTRHSAEVLVAAKVEYAQLAQDFQRVVDATRNWDAEDPTAPAMRQAYLYALSQQQKQHQNVK